VNAHSPPGGGGERAFTVELVGVWPKTTALVSGTRDHRIGWIADRQRGLIARLQLLAIGISSSAIDRLIRSGHLRRVHPGVYLVGHRAPVPLAEETAALIALRDGAVLSHQSAAILWRILAPGAGDGRLHALVLGNARAGRLDRVRVHRTTVLAPADLRTRQGLPLTSPIRTLQDCAAVLTDRALELAVDQAIVLHLIGEDGLAELRRRCAGRPGGPRLAAILDGWNGPTITRSEAEEVFLRLIRQAELPAPQINVRHNGRERDYRWPEHRLIVEIDGWRSHRTQRAFDEDRRRDARATAAGDVTMRVTYRQLLDEALAVIARLAAALSGRSSPGPW
jgi:very-short-patch-repair endonuclease